MNRLEACLGRVDNKYGSFLVMRKTPAYANSFAEHCSNLRYEPPVVEALETLKYDTFIDVGAAFGYHSIIAAHFAEEVLAFEPHPLRFGLLKWNTKDIKNIFISEEFVGPYGTTPVTSLHTMGSVGNKRDNRQFVLNLGVVSLHDLLSTRLDKKVIVKIDVEGNELDVIDSADIKNNNYENVTWIVERHPWNVSRDDLFSRFEPFGYSGKGIFNDKKKHYITEIFKFWREE